MSRSNSREKLSLNMEGMCCPNEVNVLKKALQERDGVEDVQADLLQHRLHVDYEPAKIREEEIIKALNETGMKAEKLSTGRPAAAKEADESLLPVVLSGIFTALAMAAEWIFHTEGAAKALFTGAIVSGGWSLAPMIWTSLKQFRLDMNVLMLIGILGAVGLGKLEEAASIAFLFALSELLEKFSLDRARNAVHSLMALTPDTALVLREGQGAPTPVEKVQVGETVRVRSGDRVPLDGTVISGRSFVNEAPITGESMPVEKEAGSSVFAGTLNQDGSLDVRVDKVASESMLARVQQMIEQAKLRRSPTESFVDTFAGYYTPAVIALAVILMVAPPLLLGGSWSEWFYRSLVILVISCPCALVISTPVTVVSALASAARNGVLIKGGAYLEEIGKAKVFAFDKTGTLTQGSPNITEVFSFHDREHGNVLGIAASLSRHSQHPLSQAISTYADSRNIAVSEATNFISHPGRGVAADVDGTQFLMGNHRLFEEHDLCHDVLHDWMKQYEDDHRIAIGIGSREQAVGSLLMMDTLRRHTPETIQELKDEGIEHVYMLTGDNIGTAGRIARQAGISQTHAALLPEDKVKRVEELVRQNRHVVMVGDGVNDAPALAAASVGIAMGAMGSDIALEAAPVALMSDDLRKIPWLLRHSRRTARTIRWNIFWALFIKLFFMALAIPGLATLWMAVIADTGASLLVTANGLRMLRIKD